MIREEEKQNKRVFSTRVLHGKRFNVATAAGNVYRAGLGGMERVSKAGSVSRLGRTICYSQVRYLCCTRSARRQFNLGKTYSPRAGKFANFFFKRRAVATVVSQLSGS